MSAPSRPTYTSARPRLYTYGLKEDEYQRLVDEVAGRCPICRRSVERLAVDHDHRTSTIRGVLCDRCNRAIGHLQDSA